MKPLEIVLPENFNNMEKCATTIFSVRVLDVLLLHTMTKYLKRTMPPVLPSLAVDEHTKGECTLFCNASLLWIVACNNFFALRNVQTFCATESHFFALLSLISFWREPCSPALLL